jgi:hypothetical protein
MTVDDSLRFSGFNVDETINRNIITDVIIQKVITDNRPGINSFIQNNELYFNETPMNSKIQTEIFGNVIRPNSELDLKATDEF